MAGAIWAAPAPPSPEFRVSPAVAAVIAAIETDVIRSRILPRTRLIEDHLMEDYGAKRHVIRAALTELERLGVVIKPPHCGAELRWFDAPDLTRLYATREVLHRAAVLMMRLPPSPAAMDALEAVREQHAAASAQLDLIGIHRTNMAFHRLFFGLCDNHYLADTIRLYDWLSFPARAYGAADPAALALACEEHRAMVQAARDGDATGLSRLAVVHMDRARRIYEAKFLNGPLPDQPSSK